MGSGSPRPNSIELTHRPGGIHLAGPMPMEGTMRLLEHRQRIVDAVDVVESAKVGLKGMYRGIDPIIDKICDLVTPWYAVPESVTRPIIICLWGMTGTGKTSLVRNLCNLFLKRPLIQIDLGSFTQDKDFAMEFFRNYPDHSSTSSVIMLDEIQNPRTIDEDGAEVDREGLRGMWSLLSDGIIIPDIRLEKEDCIITLENIARVYDERNGEPPQKVERPASVVDVGGRMIVIDDDEDDDVDEDGIPWQMNYDHRTGHWGIERAYIEKTLIACNKRGLSHRKKLEQQLNNDFRGTIDVMLSWLYDIDVQPVLDYSKCLIIITGNVDEVYDAARLTNPDITADVLHEWSKRVTVPDVKQSLLRRFRPEQVARLGNNHVLYPTLREEDFRCIIQDDLRRVISFHGEHFDVDLEFDESVEHLIYKEGVFPTQGARPVLATTATMVDGAIPFCLLRLAERYTEENAPDRCRVLMSMTSEPSTVRFDELVDGERIRLGELPLTLAIEILRKPVFDDDHVSIAIHEAGHAVLNIIEMGDIPVKVCAFSTDPFSLGFTDRRPEEGNRLMTRQQIVADLVTTLGGWAAEWMILGEDNVTGGGQHDLEIATEIATEYFMSCGFGGDTMVIDKPASDDDTTVTMTPADEKKIRKLLDKARDRSKSLVERHIAAILDIARSLVSTSSLSGDEVMSICRTHGIEIEKMVSRREIFTRLLEKYGMDMIEEIPTDTEGHRAGQE